MESTTGQFRISIKVSLNQTREFVITYKVNTDSKRPGTALIDRKGYLFVSCTLHNSDCCAVQDDNSTCPEQSMISKDETVHTVCNNCYSSFHIM